MPNDSQSDEDGARWLTVADVAALLSIHPGSVRRLIQSGALPAHRIGHGQRGRLRVDPADLADLLKREEGHER